MVVAIATLLVTRYCAGSDEDKVRYTTGKVTKGNLTTTVSATGNVQPTKRVDIGSELSGTVTAVFADENDIVRAGQVLAQLDVTKLRDEVARTTATLDAAVARVAQAAATFEEARDSLARHRQASMLSNGKVPAATAIEAAEAAYERASADRTSAEASVREMRAVLRTNETNLRKASIRSPIDGVVLTRAVEPGQTVAAAFQAPVLFTLAQNLTQMELEVDIDEADVGQVRAGQSATFGVDAYPNRRYQSDVSRVAMGSQTKEGVVSYKGTLAFTNADGSLRPGMTATTEIVTDNRSDVLMVPNAALQFIPTSTQEKSGFFAPPSGSPKRVGGGSPRVWILREGTPVALPVTPGTSNGRFTEVTGSGVQAGLDVIIEEVKTDG